jgi:6-phosphofructokinase 2
MAAPGKHPLHHDPIVTVTPNPALDISTTATRVIPEHKMRCGPTRLDPGGGGINVSRVIRNLGGRSIAVYSVGGPTGQAYRELLEDEGLAGHAVRVGANTRSSFTVDETDTGEQFRFVLPGPELREPEWRAFLSAVGDDMPVGGYVVPSGSLPPGAPVDFYARIARIAREKGTRCVVDTSGEALRAALDEGVYLIKPSRRELGELVGAELHDELDMQEAARDLVDAGACEVVALTMAGAGALVVTADGAFRLPAAEIVVRSTVGAGDSFLGGFVLRLAQGNDVPTSLRTAVACGGATSMLPGTELCRSDDVHALEAGLTPIDVMRARRPRP